MPCPLTFCPDMASAAANPATASSLELGRLATTLSDGDRRFRLVVEGLSLQRGAVWALTGNSGTGKTLFLEMLGLLRAPSPDSRLICHEAGRLTNLCALWRARPVWRAARARSLALCRIPVGWCPSCRRRKTLP